MFWRNHGIPIVTGHTDFAEPIRRIGLKTKGHDNRVGFDHDLTTRHRLGPSPAISAGFTELCLDHFHTDRLTKVIHHFDGLSIKQKLDTFFFGIGHLTT